MTDKEVKRIINESYLNVCAKCNNEHKIEKTKSDELIEKFNRRYGK